MNDADKNKLFKKWFIITYSQYILLRPTGTFIQGRAVSDVLSRRKVTEVHSTGWTVGTVDYAQLGLHALKRMCYIWVLYVRNITGQLRRIDWLQLGVDAV